MPATTVPRAAVRGTRSRACPATEFRRRCCIRHRHYTSAFSISTVRVERHHGDARQELGALPELALHRGRHERTEHQNRRQRNAGVELVSAQEPPVDDRHPVVAAAHGHQHVRLLADRNRSRFGQLRHRAADTRYRESSCVRPTDTRPRQAGRRNPRGRRPRSRRRHVPAWAAPASASTPSGGGSARP